MIMKKVKNTNKKLKIMIPTYLFEIASKVIDSQRRDASIIACPVSWLMTCSAIDPATLHKEEHNGDMTLSPKAIERATLTQKSILKPI
jgi:hypothetical protein